MFSNTLFIARRVLPMHETAQRLLAAGLAKGERTFTGIARTLGASDQSATNWKTRGVPRRVMIRAAALYGVDAAWLAGDADGKAPAFLATRSYPTASASAPAPKVNEARPAYAMTDDERLLLDGYRLADDSLRRSMVVLATDALARFGKRRANHNEPH